MLGEGILKGLAETARNFARQLRRRRTGSPRFNIPRSACRCPRPRAISRSSSTTAPTGEAGLRCVACQICEKECPPKCIYIEKSKDKKPDAVGKPQFYPAASTSISPSA